LTLAVYLLSKIDINIYIGWNHKINEQALKSEFPGIYFAIKGKTKKGFEFLEILRNKGFKLVAQDEESGISFVKWEDFALFRSEIQGNDYFDVFYSWGDSDFNALKGKFPNLKILKTGSPRTLLWSEKGDKFYAEDVTYLQNNYGGYVLIVTGFATANGLMKKREVLYNYFLQRKNFYAYLSYFKRLIWQRKALKVTKSLIDYLLRTSTENIVIRPHPSENSNTWKKKYKSEPRIFIDSSIESIPLVIAANRILHCGSTVAFEGLFLNKQTISYSNLIDVDPYPKLTNLVSQQIDSLNELNLIKNKDSIRVEFKNLIENNTINIGNLKSVSSQAISLIKLFEDEFRTTNKINYEINSHKLLFKNLRKIFRYIVVGKSSNLKIHHSKRPKILKLKIESDILKLKKLMEINQDIQVIEIATSTFKLERK